jgi:catechol 2,3-dioxygenase-like lactoylglutathione lyase family enzyme
VALRLGSAVINCADLEVMTAFWSQALGLRPGPATEGGAFRVLGGEQLNVSLQVARTPVTARDQMHLDLYTADKPEEVERLVALGATWVRTSGDPDDDYDVLRDPEGNEFCVCYVPDRTDV